MNTKARIDNKRWGATGWRNCCVVVARAARRVAPKRGGHHHPAYRIAKHAACTYWRAYNKQTHPFPPYVHPGLPGTPVFLCAASPSFAISTPLEFVLIIIIIKNFLPLWVRYAGPCPTAAAFPRSVVLHTSACCLCLLNICLA